MKKDLFSKPVRGRGVTPPTLQAYPPPVRRGVAKVELL